MEYKIKINKSFNTDTEKEEVKYYIKKKSVFGWWYIKHPFEDDEWVQLFAPTLFLDLILTLSYLYKSDCFSILNLTYGMLFLRFIWYILSFYILKIDFKSEQSAMDYIKNRIRKSNLKKYNTTEDIKVTYKNGELEIIKDKKDEI